MQPISDDRIVKRAGKFVASCSCGAVSEFASKGSAINMLTRGSCRRCRSDYRSVRDVSLPVYKRHDGKWCCICSGCGGEQAYTRKDHARQSCISDWQCKKCSAASKKYSQNTPIGDEGRLYNKFRKSASSRGIHWDLSQDEMFCNFDGFCAMTGWPISLTYGDQTASLDRINSALGYVPENIQWVHAMVNMCKNKYSQDDFVKMCAAVADKVKWAPEVRI